MKNIISNTTENFSNLHNGKGSKEDQRIAAQFYAETIYQISLMLNELRDINEEDLSKAEKNILRILKS